MLKGQVFEREEMGTGRTAGLRVTLAVDVAVAGPAALVSAPKAEQWWNFTNLHFRHTSCPR